MKICRLYHSLLDGQILNQRIFLDEKVAFHEYRVLSEHASALSFTTRTILEIGGYVRCWQEVQGVDAFNSLRIGAQQMQGHQLPMSPELPNWLLQQIPQQVPQNAPSHLPQEPLQPLRHNQTPPPINSQARSGVSQSLPRQVLRTPTNASPQRSYSPQQIPFPEKQNSH